MKEGFLGLQSWGLDLVTPKILVLHQKAAGVRLQEHHPGRLPSDSEVHHAPWFHIYATWSPTSGHLTSLNFVSSFKVEVSRTPHLQSS